MSWLLVLYILPSPLPLPFLKLPNAPHIIQPKRFHHVSDSQFLSWSYFCYKFSGKTQLLYHLRDSVSLLVNPNKYKRYFCMCQTWLHCVNGHFPRLHRINIILSAGKPEELPPKRKPNPILIVDFGDFALYHLSWISDWKFPHQWTWRKSWVF